MEQETLFEVQESQITQAHLNEPKGYRGFAAFHKYWGKKPVECLSYLIENLTLEEEVVLDPFIGSGLIAREALERNRKFIGIDINPIAVELSKLIVSPPSYKEFSEAIVRMEKEIRPSIDGSYQLVNGEIATHYLWDKENLKSVWRIGKGKRLREEYEPVNHDYQLYNKYLNYKSKHIRTLKFFNNSRINTNSQMTINNLFTGRALCNIDTILKYIKKQPDNIKKGLLLSLTAASGQMSKMVFAVSQRGKVNGKVKQGISVGSWVIGYWRPRLHFEINAWNCFHNRARRLLKALKEVNKKINISLTSDALDIFKGKSNVSLVKNDACLVLKDLPSESISLILTDPPHSDRMPYLELSELWNAILGQESSFEREIVVSNARERSKDKNAYNDEMLEFLIVALKTLCKGGIIALLFNARDSESWQYLDAIKKKSHTVTFRGCFPMSYSASSVVQDNRKGAMKYDYVLIYEKCPKSSSSERWRALTQLNGWSFSLPKKEV